MRAPVLHNFFILNPVRLSITVILYNLSKAIARSLSHHCKGFLQGGNSMYLLVAWYFHQDLTEHFEDSPLTMWYFEIFVNLTGLFSG
jgi:hypothetical protein